MFLYYFMAMPTCIALIMWVIHKIKVERDTNFFGLHKQERIDRIFEDLQRRQKELQQKGDTLNGLCYSGGVVCLIKQSDVEGVSYKDDPSRFINGERFSMPQYELTRDVMDSVMKGLCQRMGAGWRLYQDYIQLSAGGPISSRYVSIGSASGDTKSYYVTAGTGGGSVFFYTFICREEDYLSNRKKYISKTSDACMKKSNRKLRKSLNGVQ